MNQTQREATLDLLIVSLYADSHLSLLEDEALASALLALGWESPKPRDIYFCNSLRRARNATNDEQTLSDYLTQKAACFDTKESKGEALKLLSEVITCDGISPAESSFIRQLQILLS